MRGVWCDEGVATRHVPGASPPIPHRLPHQRIFLGLEPEVEDVHQYGGHCAQHEPRGAECTGDRTFWSRKGVDDDGRPCVDQSEDDQSGHLDPAPKCGAVGDAEKLDCSDIDDSHDDAVDEIDDAHDEVGDIRRVTTESVHEALPFFSLYLG